MWLPRARQADAGIHGASPLVQGLDGEGGKGGLAREEARRGRALDR